MRMGFVWHFHACKMVRLVQMWYSEHLELATLTTIGSK